MKNVEDQRTSMSFIRVTSRRPSPPFVSFPNDVRGILGSLAWSATCIDKLTCCCNNIRPECMSVAVIVRVVHGNLCIDSSGTADYDNGF
jgi:hypothetical protein